MQSAEEKNKTEESVCQHCLSGITVPEDLLFCPACGTAYHEYCWRKNHGCAVISCTQKNILLNPLFSPAIPVRELLVHVEYLMNLKKYSEAVNECVRILSADKDNTEAKALYNRATALINIRMKIYESADDSFRKKEYKASAMFYKDYLKYCDEEEREFISTRIKYIGELLPAMARKKKIVNALYVFIALLIVISAGFIAYRNIYLRDDFEFAEIEHEDGVNSLREMETQIGRYEKFIMKYPESKLRDRADEKISALSENLIKRIYAEDWRVSLEYLKKINTKENPKTYNDLYRIIYSTADNEFQQIKKEAAKLDGQKKYSEARAQVEKNLALIENFRNTDLERQRQQLLDVKNLLNKKISYTAKVRDIDKEISEKTDELKKQEPGLGAEDIVIIEGRVVKKTETGYVIKSFSDKKLYAVISDRFIYEPGEDAAITGYKKGKTEIRDDAGNVMIMPSVIVLPDRESALNSDKNSLLQRLYFLKEQKGKIDSVLKIGI